MNPYQEEQSSYTETQDEQTSDSERQSTTIVNAYDNSTVLVNPVINITGTENLDKLVDESLVVQDDLSESVDNSQEADNDSELVVVKGSLNTIEKNHVMCITFYFVHRCCWYIKCY